MSKNVLVVDDELTMQRLAKKYLEAEGYKVYVAGNGLEGLNVLRGTIIDAIVLDIIMPVMDGIDFFKTIKATPDSANIPVVIITQKQMIEESFRYLGVNEFLSKPVEGKKLIEKVNKVLKYSAERHHIHKVLIIGSDAEILDEMSEILKSAGNHTQWVKEGAESIPHALVMMPDIILIDVFIRDFSAKEIIRALKAFNKLTDSEIFVFSALSAQEVGSSDILSMLDTQVSECLTAGAAGYWGRYNKLTFLDTFRNKSQQKS